MKHIQKTNPPPGNLTPYLNWVNNNLSRLSGLNGLNQWDQLDKPIKKNLQEVLINEQGFICAYCNRRIHHGHPEDDEQLRIDHIEPKSIHSNRVFDYFNLVGCCFGDERELNRNNPPRSLHCDVSKKESEIPMLLFPTSTSCETIVNYSVEGEISSTLEDVDQALKITLNLNCEKLINDRKKVLTPFDPSEIEFTPEEAALLISFYEMRNAPQGEFEPYCGVIIGFLRQNFIN